ncbi:MAG: hypothetical protein JXR15_00050 [Shimia sp.]|uniref:hypothetical protein n=1 Tax=Shimia sp. TaxID=1954381 RepID=UPI003B8B16CE
MDSMDRFDNLVDDLLRFGWERTAIHEPQFGGGMRSRIWRFTSGWSPVGFEVFVSFLIDPQNHGLENENEIWGIEISSETTNHYVDENIVSVGRHWTKQRAEIVEIINSLRVQAD